MNDADEPQSASGSWQPDPTGRYKLRWRNEAGNWTDHVYSSEGELGNDPYSAPSEQHPAQGLSTAPTEPPPAGQPEQTEANDTGSQGPKPKRPIYRRWWAFVLYGFVILVVIASLVDVDEDEDSVGTAPATTTVRTTTTSLQTWTVDDCANYSSALEFLSNEVAGLFAQLALEATFADLTGMQETYDTLEWAMDGLPEATYTMIEICRAHVPQSAIDLVELSLEEATSDWRELQRTCRSELADFGLEC